MSVFSFNRLQTKITIILIVILAVTISANNWISTHVFKEKYTEALQQHVVVIGQSLKNQLDRIQSIGIAVQDLVGFEEQCREIIRKYPEVSLVYVTDRNGSILFSSETPSGGQAQPIESQRVQEPVLLTALHSDTERVVYYNKEDTSFLAAVVPFKHLNPTAEGAVLIIVSGDIIAEQTQSLVQYPLFLTIIFFIAAFFLLSAILTKWVTRPLSHMVHQMNEVAQGNMHAAVPATGKDEIAQVGSAFNHMVVKLDDLLKRTAQTAELESRYQLELQQRIMAEKLRLAYYSLSSTLDVEKLKTQVASNLRLIIPFHDSQVELWTCASVQEAEERCSYPHVQTDEEGTVLSLPFPVNGERMGVLILRHDGYYSSTEINLAFTFAGQFGIFFQNAILYKQMQEMAATDTLTGLFNRRSWFQQAQAAVVQSGEEGTCFGVIMFDIDHFKKINDTFGHQSGDEVLAQVAHCLRQLLEGRKDSLYGRYGGEEFMILLRDTTEEQLLELAETLRMHVEALELSVQGEIAGMTLKITISLGGALSAGGTYSVDKLLEEMLRRADLALYEAKAEGRNRVKLYPGSGPVLTKPDQEVG